MLATSGSQLPHKWIVGDDEYWRPSAFRDRLAERSERYVLEVPSSMSVRKMRADSGRPPMWHTIKALVRRAPVDAWDCYQVRDGQKGPIQVRAIRIPVETRRPRADPRRETLLVMETLDGSDRWHFLTNASDEEPTSVLVRVAGQRHLIEEAFELGKGEAVLDHYGVRTWQGWHHHTACALLGGWFLVRESRRLGKKAPSMTANLVRSALSELMRKPKSPGEIAAMCLRQLRRNEAARVAHWRAKGLTAPPRRRVQA